MYQKIKILADLRLFSGENMRQTPFVSGYRPLFSFPGALTKISGKIDLIKNASFYPGTHDVVQVTFLKGMIENKYFTASQTFAISEGGGYSLGDGCIIEILSDD